MYKKTVSGILLILLVTNLLTLAFINQSVRQVISESRTIIVPDDCPTIQAAIDAASPGDTIYVKKGVYYENIVVNKSYLFLVGESAKDTIIDGLHKTVVVLIEAEGVIFENFTVQNGADPALPAMQHSGIGVRNCSMVTIKNNIIKGNDEGIWLLSASMCSITNNLIIDNYVSGIKISKWSLSCLVPESNDVNNNTIKRNFHGIFLRDTHDNRIIGNYIIENNATGIWLESSSMNRIYHNSFIDNKYQVRSYESRNIWDEGYPSGGNYWSDYAGIDEKSGPDQDQPGSDGIGDTPYVIDENNVDRYPLMQPWKPPTAKVDATIVSYSISSGQFMVGDDVSAEVTVRNTGQESWTFYVGYSVQDETGKWWDAPYEAVTLNPGEEETVTLCWTVNPQAPAGYYNARVAVWRDKTDDILVDMLDYRDKNNAFRIVSLEEVCARNAELAKARALTYGNYTKFFEYVCGYDRSITPDLFISSFEHLEKIMEGLLELGFSDNILNKVKATINVIAEFKEWLDDIQESIETLVQQIETGGVFGSLVEEWLWKLKAKCLIEMIEWQEKDVNGAINTIKEELDLITELDYWYYSQGQGLLDLWRASSSGPLVTETYNSIDSFLDADNQTLVSVKEMFKDTRILDIKVYCDIDVHLYDEEGRHTGAVYDEYGNVVGIEHEIPNVCYSGPFIANESLMIVLGNETRKFDLVIVERSGASYNYTLELSFYDKRGNLVNTWSRQYPVSANESQTLTIEVNATSYQTEVNLKAGIDVNPDALNLASKGEWITAYIELPVSYNVSGINVSSILLNNTISAELIPTTIGDYDNDSIPDLMIKFDRASVISYVLANVNKTKLFEDRFMRVTLTMTGYLNDGTRFQGTATIRVSMPIPFFVSKIWRFCRTL